MGLDISYYRRVSLAPDAKVDSDGCPEDWDNHTRVYLNDAFPGRADDITDRAIYKTEDGDGFRAGSYGSYNDWREWLAKLAGYAAVPTSDARHQHSDGAGVAGAGPFYELIHFSDCEGVIGAQVSAKLAKDFADFQERADASDSGWFAAKYAEWRKAFETAADGGFVDFH